MKRQKNMKTGDRCKGKPNTNIEENRRRYTGKPEIEMQKIREQENQRQIYRQTKDRKTGDRCTEKPKT